MTDAGGPGGRVPAPPPEPEINGLRRRLAELEETVAAIGSGAIDALVVSDARGTRVFTLETTDHVFRVFVEQMSDGAATLDKAGTILWANRRLPGMVGMPLERVIGSQFLEMVHPDDTGLVEDLLGVSRTGRASADVRVLRADGDPVPARLIAWAIPSDEAVASAILLVDLTDQRRLEREGAAHAQALVDAEARFRATINALSDPLVILSAVRDDKGAIVDFVYDYANEAALVANGATREAQIGRRLLGFLPEHVPSGMLALYARTVESGEPLVLDGVSSEDLWGGGLVRRVFDVRATSFGDALAYTWRDVTGREAAQAAMREQAHLLALAHDAILVKDPDGRILFWSAGAEQTYGWTTEEVAGRDASELLGTVLPVAREAVEEALGATGEWQGELRQVTRDGRTLAITSRWSVERNVEGGVSAILEINRDVTQEQAERASLQAQLSQAQRLESVGRLAGGVAHDFNNMLGVILGLTTLTLDAVEHGSPIHADLLEIQKAAQRSADLTRALLAFARVQPVAPVIIDPNAAVTATLAILRRLAGEDVELAWEPGPDIWRVRLDPSQLDQVLANLCANARDAVSGQGTVTITTMNITTDAVFCAGRPDARPGDFVRLTVSDTGSGMSPEVLLHLFEPFFTTKPVGSGTGLGLASVYGIVQQNQGFIRVTSEPGHGTTFELYLPRWIGPRRAHAAQVSAVAPRGRETILLVEDEATLLALGARMLEAQGYTILRAARPTEALRLAADDGVRIDLIVSDVVMPGMSGPDLVAQLRSGWPDLPCLFMSGYPDREVTGSGDHFIGKPFTSADLAVAVRAALDEVRVGSVSPGLSQARLD